MINQEKSHLEAPGALGKRGLRTAILTCLAITSIAASIGASAQDAELDRIHVVGSRLNPVSLMQVPNFNWHWGQGSVRFGETFLGSDMFSPGQGSDTSAVPDPNNMCGNPVVFSRANKYESETDFTSYGGEMPLFLERTYSEKDYLEPGLFGHKWRTNFDYRLMRREWPDGYGGYIELVRPDRRTLFVDEVDESGNYLNGAGPVQPGVDYVVWRPNQNRYSYYAHDGSVEEYSSNDLITERKSPEGIKWVFTYGGPNNDRLVRVTHSSGRYVQFNWNASWSEVIAAIDPAGTQYSYTYAPVPSGWSGKTLSSVVKPGGTTVSYQYDHSVFVGRLTGKAYNGTQYSIFSYWPGGQSTEHAGGVNKFSYTYGYDSNGQVASAIETSPLGLYTKYDFVDDQRVSTTGYASSNCSASFKSATYDSGGALDIVTDYLGNVTDYDYDFFDHQKRLVRKIEAKGTPAQRTSTYVWDNKNRIIQETIVGLRRTNYSYRSDNRMGAIVTTNLSSNGVSGQSQVTGFGYAFHANGLPSAISVDGPLDGTSDIVTSTYDSYGNLTSSQNSLGHAITYANYNALGQPRRITNENGAVKEFIYDALGRVTVEHDYVNSSVASTQYVYNNVGLLHKIITPDGVQWIHEYDAARRLISKTEQPASGFGNKIIYTLDNASNVTKEQIWKLDAAGNIAAMSYQSFYDFDDLGRLRARRGNSGQNLRYSYDNNGNVRTVTDSLNRVTTLTYDALNRLIASVDPLNGVTRFEYGVSDQITKATDPRGLNTTYIYDGFGQLWAQYSPDTGTTTFQYNAAGLRTSISRADASGLVYAYDALGRLTWYGTSTEGRGYSYDWCSNGRGRLCEASTIERGRHYGYTPHGQIAVTRDFTAGLVADDWTGYSYDNQGRLNGISYPSGVVVGYGYNNGKLTLMNTTLANGVSHVIASSINYHPFGGISSAIYGNNLQRLQQTDLDGRLTAIHTDNIQGLYYQYNINDEITQITNGADASLSQTFGYDALGRLTNAVAPGNTAGFGYDPIGNRTSRSDNGVTATYAYPANSHRLQSVISPNLIRSFNSNAVGNIDGWTGADGVYNTMLYDAYVRPKQHARNGTTTTYRYNALDQRVSKSNSSLTARYVYSGQNTLLAENNNGQWTTHLWLGNQPVGVVKGNAMYWVHADHLGRPEMVTNPSQQRVWRAANWAFNRSVVLDQIGGYNLGFPGQYWDSESNLWQNGFRDYEPTLGRYLQSDPIGLSGGMNTYGYAVGNPVSVFDPFGLDTYLVNRDLSVLGDSARSRDDLVTHTFVVVTNADGSINATYSWGNDANLRGWNENQSIDLKTAREALDKGLAEKVGDSRLDPYVHKAYQKNQKNRMFLEHNNGIVYNNCKTEANELIKYARFLQSLGVSPSTIW
jgi:RHS repeat-associated protein